MSVAAELHPRDDVSNRSLALLTRALGHPARVRIMRLLLTRETCFCGEIVDELPLAQATVSEHLRVLKQAGLIKGEIDGPRVCYCANPARLVELRDLFDELFADAVEDVRTSRGCD